jgi:hypothetical protein
MDKVTEKHTVIDADYEVPVAESFDISDKNRTKEHVGTETGKLTGLGSQIFQIVVNNINDRKILFQETVEFIIFVLVIRDYFLIIVDSESYFAL